MELSSLQYFSILGTENSSNGLKLDIESYSESLVILEMKNVTAPSTIYRAWLDILLKAS